VKEKFVKRGFVIAEILLKKKKISCEGLPDSQNSIVGEEFVKMAL
jgi:hypothetical protein